MGASEDEQVKKLVIAGAVTIALWALIAKTVTGCYTAICK
jgi:hypothetical protein